MQLMRVQHASQLHRPQVAAAAAVCITGLAQEQVDAMAPAISHLKGMEPHSSKHSRNPSSMYSESAAASASGQAGSSAAAARAAEFTPQSSFKVSMAALPEEQRAQGAASAAASPVAGSAAASASASTSPSKQPSMQRGQLLVSPGRQSPSQQSPGALSRKDSLSRQASSKAPGSAGAAAGAAGGLIASRASSRQLMEELDLFELAAGLGGNSSRKLGM
jgi:hypothetical protein